MKIINQYISEKLKVNSKSKINNTSINCELKITGNTAISDEEINIIQEYIQKLDINPKPIVLTNSYYYEDDHKLYHTKNDLYMYFYDNWENTEQSYYVIFIKYRNTDKFSINIVINKNFYSLNDADDSPIIGNIKLVCQELVKQLPNFKTLYHIK